MRAKKTSNSASKKRQLDHDPQDDQVTKKIKDSPEAEPAEPSELPTKETWNGFCNIESEPAVFAAIMRELGVKGVTVREALHDDFGISFETIPLRIFGMVLLFRAREVSSDQQDQKDPGEVWFANQLPAQNSCASLAMINILLNQDPANVDVGEHLDQFKDFTNEMTPFARGEVLASWEFLKRTHNSYAKRMDMLQDDQHLANKVAKNRQSRRGSATSNGTQASDDSIEESAHHFIAFVPVNGQLWKLDGMDAQPTMLGIIDDKDSEGWLAMATTKVASLMAAAGDDDYTLLALCESPTEASRKKLCTSLKTFRLVEERLDCIDKDWKEFVVDDQLPPSPTMLNFVGIFEKDIEQAEVASDLKETIAAEEKMFLIDRRKRLIAEQAKLHQMTMEEKLEEDAEDEQARERKWDYGPAIKAWVEMLAENGYLEANLGRFWKK
jgi:ubiquitin carboxyl-terminal hydrolase L5